MSSAASFIDQINAAYREVVKAESAALPHAIKCGEFLNLAKENLKAEKGGKWKDWLETNCEVKQTTASLYMRLAKNKKVAAKAKSIREANEIILKSNNNQPRGQSTNQVDGDGQANASVASGHSLESELETLAPDEVCKLLVDTWDDDDKLRELCS